MSYSHFSQDPDDIRFSVEAGGGGLMDVGCYCVAMMRFIFNGEPRESWRLRVRQVRMQLTMSRRQCSSSSKVTVVSSVRSSLTQPAGANSR